MYIQITTWCNMTCAHCCMSCSSGHVGQHMSMTTFNNALSLAKEYDDLITLGGGEPTLHPKFMEMLFKTMEVMQGYSRGYCEEYIPWLATNGSQTKIMYELFQLMHPDMETYDDIFEQSRRYGCYGFELAGENPLVSVAISQNNYHDPISQPILDLWKNNGHEIRNVSGHERNAGFCDFGVSDSCVCSTLQIKPDGSVFLCGCDEAPYLGNVNDLNWEFDWEDQVEHPECVKSIDPDDEDPDMQDWYDYLATSPRTVADWVAENQKPKEMIRGAKASVIIIDDIKE